MKTINSLSNQTIKEAVRLKKTGERKTRGLIIIDGAREIELAIEAGLKINNLFYCPSLIKGTVGNSDKFFGVATEKIIEVSESAFHKISYKEKPEGFLAIAETKETTFKDIRLNDNPLIVVLEAVEKPGNLGAIIRTAYAAGAAAVIVNDNQTDIYNPNVIRASEGLVFTEKVVSASIVETIKWLKEKKIKSFGAATGASKNYTQVDLSGPTAIILGSESEGLSAKWLKDADELIKIPMNKGIDSLNVSVAAAVIIFEVLRQREVAK